MVCLHLQEGTTPLERFSFRIKLGTYSCPRLLACYLFLLECSNHTGICMDQKDQQDYFTLQDCDHQSRRHSSPLPRLRLRRLLAVF